MVKNHYERAVEIHTQYAKGLCGPADIAAALKEAAEEARGEERSALGPVFDAYITYIETMAACAGNLGTVDGQAPTCTHARDCTDRLEAAWAKVTAAVEFYRSRP